MKLLILGCFALAMMIGPILDASAEPRKSKSLSKSRIITSPSYSSHNYNSPRYYTGSYSWSPGYTRTWPGNSFSTPGGVGIGTRSTRPSVLTPWYYNPYGYDDGYYGNYGNYYGNYSNYSNYGNYGYYGNYYGGYYR